MASSTNATAKDIRKVQESSSIFQDNQASKYTKPISGTRKYRDIKTFQDSNIFGWKDANSISITSEAKQQLDQANQNGKIRDIPTFNKTTITEHSYNEAQERKKEEWKLRRKGTMPNLMEYGQDPNLSGYAADTPLSNRSKVLKATTISNPKQDCQLASLRRTIEHHSDIFHLDNDDIGANHGSTSSRYLTKVKTKPNPKEALLKQLGSNTSHELLNNYSSAPVKNTESNNSSFIDAKSESGSAKLDPTKIKSRLTGVAAKPANKIVEVETLDLDLKNLPSYVNEATLKDMTKGLHVIEIKPDFHSISGQSLGSARLRIRNDNKVKAEELKSKLQSEGILVTDHVEKKKGLTHIYRKKK